MLGGDRYWLVSSGDLKRVRVRARDPREAFITAVALHRPKALGSIVEVQAEVVDAELARLDPDGRFYVTPRVLSREFQEFGDVPSRRGP
jgi:hypothetical protein